ncbi:MAG: phosphotransferase, partial [Lentisphaerae bacterium]|nr:phosphotransferase [Lentisphaerota bacterium]
VILSAGLGTRLRPLSFDTPKPLMPLWGEPLLNRVLTTMSSWGVSDVLINLHYMPDAIFSHLLRQPVRGLRVNLSYEPELLGTGGALRHAAWFLNDAPFWLVNADIVFQVDPRPLLTSLRKHQALAALWMVPDRGPCTVAVRDGLVVDFHSSNRTSAMTFSGLHLLQPGILRYLPPQGPASIIQAYESAIRHGASLAGVTVPGSYWNDLGTPQGYLAAHAETRPHARRGSRGVIAGAGATLARRADLCNLVAWPGSRAGAELRAHNVILGRGTRPRHHVPNCAVLAVYLPHEPVLDTALSRLGWSREKTTVVPLEPRGSARVFTRLCCACRSVIMMAYRRERPENSRYPAHTALLQSAGVDVPSIILDEPRLGLVLLEDLGADSLELLADRANTATRHRLLWNAMANMRRMHIQGTRLVKLQRARLEPGFGSALYRWERELFRHWFLRKHCPARTAARIIAELAQTAELLAQSRQCLIHRDLQSSNILIRHDRAYFIDFQGMRMGAASYDLASLLYDPYLELAEPAIDRLLRAYNDMAAPGQRIPADLLRHAAVERLAQALGAYGRLGANPATDRFLRFIPPALRLMENALEQLNDYHVLRQVVRSLTQYCAHRTED